MARQANFVRRIVRMQGAWLVCLILLSSGPAFLWHGHAEAGGKFGTLNVKQVGKKYEELNMILWSAQASPERKRGALRDLEALHARLKQLIEAAEKVPKDAPDRDNVRIQDMKRLEEPMAKQIEASRKQMPKGTGIELDPEKTVQASHDEKQSDRKRAETLQDPRLLFLRGRGPKPEAIEGDLRYYGEPLRLEARYRSRPHWKAKQAKIEWTSDRSRSKTVPLRETDDRRLFRSDFFYIEPVRPANRHIPLPLEATIEATLAKSTTKKTAPRRHRPWCIFIKQ